MGLFEGASIEKTVYGVETRTLQQRKSSWYSTSVKKAMLTDFWDMKGHIMLDSNT